jgi:hypothetical protein
MSTSIALRRTFPSLISSIAEVNGGESSDMYWYFVFIDIKTKGDHTVIRFAKDVGELFSATLRFECLDDGICWVKLELLVRRHTK